MIEWKNERRILKTRWEKSKKR